MSALDQAIIKAYAKDRPAASDATTRYAPAVQARPSSPSSGSAMEQVYRDGSLYRIHPCESSAPVPMPNLAHLPPTSPRRNVRRSLLRLQAATENVADGPAPPPTPARIARKVIIRHVSHSTAPPPMGLLRPGPVAARSATADLLPETFVEDQEEPKQPAKPLPPEAAPLNIALEAARPIDIQGRWLHEASIAPMVMVADGLAARRHPAYGQHLVQVDGLAAWETEARARLEQSAKRGNSTLDLRAGEISGVSQRGGVKVYIDAAHSSGRNRPHARFQADPTEDALNTGAQPQTPSTPEDAVAEKPRDGGGPNASQAQTIQAADNTAATTDELPFASAFEEALASDLIPVDQLPATGAAPSSRSTLPTGHSQPESTEAAPAEVGQTFSADSSCPVWEVDRFHWPRTCEKLLADADGYLATAGDKLLAAVQDGLKVLAITGTRRGEGRSTLALCLARAAARSGIDVAVMDADFMRPQLASKLGLETAFGWQDAALGKIPLSEAAIKSLADEITVMPLELAPATRRLSLADPRVTATVRAAAATFELLILDLGPTGAGQPIMFPRGEACPLDAAIVVRDLRFTSADEAEAVGEMLHGVGIEAVGVAENFVVDEEVPATSV